MGVVNIIEDYNQLFDIVWHTDGYGNKVNLKRINEQHQVIGNIILLNEIPDEFRKVIISNMHELKKGSKIKYENEFIVDYLTGAITFHESKESSTINVDEYYGRGIIKSYAVRNLLLDRKGNWESNNVEDLVHEIRQYIDGNRNELNLDVTDLQEQINSNKIDIDNKYIKHKDGITDKHKAEDIIYDGEVENCLNTKDAIDSLQGQASTILEEIIDARKGEEDLTSKVNDIDSNISNLSEIKANLDYVDEELDNLQDDLNDYKNTTNCSIENIEEDLNNFHSEFELYEGEIEDIVDDLNDAITAVDTNLTNYKTVANGKLDNIDSNIENLSNNKADISYVDNEVETLGNNFNDNLTNCKNTTNTRLDNIDNSVENLSNNKADIEYVDGELGSLENNLTSYKIATNTKIDNINTDINNIGNEIEGLSEVKIEIVDIKPEITPFWYDFSDNTGIIREEREE